MPLKFSNRLPAKWLYVLGVVLLVIAGVVWFCWQSMSPERVFWKTIEQSLATRSVTVQSKQDSAGSSVKQTVRYSLGADNLANSITLVYQGDTVVKTEMLGTPTKDYSKYISVETGQTKSDGSPLDFSRILNVWTEGEEGAGQFFAQAMFSGVSPIGGAGVPIANLSSQSRGELLQKIESSGVYQPDFGSVKKERVNGRTQYTYDVTVQPAEYIALMKGFAQAIGLHTLDQLDPMQYSGEEAFKLQIVIDAKSHHIVQIIDPNTGNSQNYVDYDIPVQIAVPTETITMDELQQRLSELQQ